MKIWMKFTRKIKCINWWSYWNSKTWNKKPDHGFPATLLAPMAGSLIAPVASSLVESIFRKGGMRSGRGAMRAGRGYNNMEHMDKNFYFHSILSAIRRLLITSITNLGLMVFLQEIIYLGKEMERKS